MEMSFTINLSITTLVVKHLGGWRNLAGQTNFQVDLNHDKHVVDTALACCRRHIVSGRRTLFFLNKGKPDSHSHILPLTALNKILYTDFVASSTRRVCISLSPPYL